MNLKKYIYEFPDSPTFYHSDIAYSEILSVWRGGLEYKETASSPGTREFNYDPNGTLSFNTSVFTGSFDIGRFIPEKILVIYRQ